MKALDKYRQKIRLKNAGKLVWYGLVWFSKITIGLFILITCITFWENEAVRIYSSTGVNYLKQISEMFLIVCIAVIVSVIDYLIKLKIKHEKSKA